MATTPMTGPQDDLSPLAWVVDEVRRSLEAAHKALRRYLKEAEASGGSDVSSVDPSMLRQVRTQIHQSVGALELVGLGVAAQPLRAAEAAVQRLSAKPSLITLKAVHTIEQGSFALLDYLARKLAGKPVSALAMFPQYRALQELAGAARAHPADLWGHEWGWRTLPLAGGQAGPAWGQPPVDEFEAEMLGLLRGHAGAASRLGELCVHQGARSQGNLASLWQLAAAFLEALADGAVALDVHAKRVVSRLLAQLRAGDSGQASERLAQDLLFFCGQAAPDAGRPACPRLAAARQAYGLEHSQAVDYESSSLGLFDPALLAQARKRVTAAKEVWSAVAAGESVRLSGLLEPFTLVGDSLKRIYPNGGLLAQALQAAAAQTQASGSEPVAALAMEVATALLYLEASLEDAEFDHPEMPDRVRRLAERVDLVRQNLEPGALDLWMEDLYRRISDRQTMGNVVQELRASLSEVEKQIDQYFRNPAQREVLIPVPSQLSAMRGVLSLLDMDHASQAVLRMRDDVDELANTEVDPERALQSGPIDRLANNLGALSFLIDMVSVQPQTAKSLFRFDPASGQLTATVARAERPSAFSAFDGQETEQPALVEQAQSIALAAARPQADAQSLERDLAQLTQQARAADQEGLARLASRAQSNLANASDAEGVELAGRQLAHSLNEFVATQEGSLSDLPTPSRPVPPPGPPVAPGQTGLEDDAEMREIFLEEAREVVEAAGAAVSSLRDRPDDLTSMTVIRRAFHTLKGSSRMVGLTAFGDAAWACEQLFNARLAESLPADADVRGFTLEVLDHFAQWVDAIEAGDASDFTPEPVLRSADALRLEQRWLRLGAVDLDTATAAPAPLTLATDPAEATLAWPPVGAATSLQARVPELPSAADLDLTLPDRPLPDAAPAPASVSVEVEAGDELPADEGFTLELAALPELPLDAGRVEVGPLSDSDLSLFAEFDAIHPVTAGEPAPIAALTLDLDSAARPGTASVLLSTEVSDLSAEARYHPDDAQVDEPTKLIGDLRVGIPLFNIYLNEADELSRRLSTDLAEWAHELNRPAGEAPVVLAHSLAGSSATVGFADLSQLARSLEHALMRSNERAQGRDIDAPLFNQAADEIRRLLHQFAAGFLRTPDPDLMLRLSALEQAPAERDETLSAVIGEPDEQPVIEIVSAPVEDVFGQLGQPALMPFAALVDEPLRAASGRGQSIDIDDDLDAVDAIDDELFPLFDEEASELIPQLHSRLRDWAAKPADQDAASACMRTLHTLKGSARLAGAMRFGEVAHRIESAIEAITAAGSASAPDVEGLIGHADTLESQLEALRHGPIAPVTAAIAGRVSGRTKAPHPALSVLPLRAVPEAPATTTAADAADRPAIDQRADGGLSAARSETASTGIDWSRFGVRPAAGTEPITSPVRAGGAAAVRVSAPLLDRLVNHAGEVSITRARIEADVEQMKAALGDLTDNLERLRSHLRDIELQAETQIGTRLEAARAAAQAFDPLEMDRFTRFQELTRMMAESVNDVATVQRGLQRSLQSTEDDLAQQSRLTRDLQDDLLRTRMVEFDGLSERLYRVVRQAAKETGKQVRLDITGGSIEVDRGVLDRMTGAFEHLLRNSVVHGIEAQAQRLARGKDPIGTITITVTQVGNEVGIDFRDDGAGLALQRIRDKALAGGLLAAGAAASDAELAALIFQAGFSTADEITGLAGRGVGMDVVRADVTAMGGRIETSTAPGQGTSFRLVLPLTTAVTQVVMMRCGDMRVAVPSTLVEIVRRVPAAQMPGLYEHGVYRHGEVDLPFYWLATLLQGSALGVTTSRTAFVVVIRSAAQQIAVHVDEVIGNQEVVVKNLGSQLSRLPGLAGLTLLPSGAPALIYNPVALATLYGQSGRAATLAALARARQSTPLTDLAVPVHQAPLVLVVDDSLTVRRVTQRLLVREGYRVTLAKDGLDGLDRLADELPALVLTDIEMPRMDGFDLVRNMRVDSRLSGLPVIMITSRIAQKHRDYAAELGVNHYLGKPYVEDDLLALVARYARKAALV